METLEDLLKSVSLTMPYPLEHRFISLHRSAGEELMDARNNRELYLRIMERIVRIAAEWLDVDGALVDPVCKDEWGLGTSRFVSSAAVLIHFGRCRDLLDNTCRSMTLCTEWLKKPSVKPLSPDFWMRELMTAYYCLKPFVDDALLSRWKNNLSDVNPEQNYYIVKPDHKDLDSLGNWAIYSSGGEIMREQFGVGGGESFLWGTRFFDLYAGAQLNRFTEYGMYCDPHTPGIADNLHAPLTYDITTRLQLANALHCGYKGRLRDTLDACLLRGDLTMLLFMSPEGFVPYGGRSGEFHFREAIVAALCELEAKRFKLSEPVLAGRFRRQAHLCAKAILPWVDDTPFRHIKNRFPPDTRHGCDEYGYYSTYAILASSLFGLAALYADDSIPEAPAISEIGGYAFELPPPFHKIFASCGGNYAEIDTCADLNHDATGLGRILLKGLPYGLLPAMPFAGKKDYITAPAISVTTTPAAIGPKGLAASENTSHEFSVVEENQRKVAWRIKWTVEEAVYVQLHELTADGLHVHTSLEGGCGPLRFEIPVLFFDGIEHAKWNVSGNAAVGRMERGGAIVTASERLQLQDTPNIANRNGIYRLLTAESLSGELDMHFAKTN